MIFRFDYLKALEAQCDAIIHKKDLNESRSAFSEICKNLVRDFLPPIEREDIAAISYALVDIAAKAENLPYPDEIKKQIDSFKPLLNNLFSKNKACGDDIRRLVEININFKSSDSKLVLLNGSLSDFYKTVLAAYFGSL